MHRDFICSEQGVKAGGHCADRDIVYWGAEGRLSGEIVREGGFLCHRKEDL